MNSARRLVMAIGIALVIASACAFQNPVSPEYPCGTQGLDCGHGLCCWRGDSCGGARLASPFVSDCYVVTLDGDDPRAS